MKLFVILTILVINSAQIRWDQISVDLSARGEVNN